MNASRYHIPVPALWPGLGVKPPDLIRTWRDPLSLSTPKPTAVAARRTGGDRDVLSTSPAPGVMSLAATLATVGFTVALSEQRLGVLWHTVVTWRRLGPLRRELGDASGGSPGGPGGRRGPGCRKNPVVSAHGVPPCRFVPPPEAPRRATAPLSPSGRPIPRTSPEGRQA